VSATDVSLRPLTIADGPFLCEMLREADRWRLPLDAPRPPLAEVLADPHVRLYVEGWGRAGDDGVVAEVAGAPAGACWLRLFDAETHGWGFVAPDVPELSIAVTPRHRRRGIGRRLLAAALARAERAGHPEISLSVMPDNPARELYLQSGFRQVGEVDGSWTMALRLRADVKLRPATAADRSFLTAMLAEAASWEREPGEPPYPLVDLLGVPEIADYIQGWGRPGDFGAVAEVAGEPVGACWGRRFTPEHPGYGFIAEAVPGLSIGIVPAHRERGVGRSLLTAVIDDARRQAVPALSLSVSERNLRARRLYERAGFVVVETEGDGLTMRLDLV
jgi:ribosomal protein S18 acetylase RimI-like enzyme